MALKPDVFISYTHADRGFVGKLAMDLFQAGLNVWWDEWEMKVGDSLLGKIGEGITGASYLIAVLSPDSVPAPWVTRELNAALSREIKEGQVVVLPAVVKKCELPPFLLDKLYADFTQSYEQGLAALLGRLKPADLGTHDRQELPDRSFNDYAFDWGEIDGYDAFNVTIASHGPDSTFSILLQIAVQANARLTKRFQAFRDNGFDWAPSLVAIHGILELSERMGGKTILRDEFPTVLPLHWVDGPNGVALHGTLTARRLGPHDHDILFEFGKTVRHIHDDHGEKAKLAVGAKRFKDWIEFASKLPI